MASTPDGVAELGFHGHADYFVTERFSFGPLAQYADDVLFRLSAQDKYWWDIPATDHLAQACVSGRSWLRSGRYQGYRQRHRETPRVRS